ncbi:MAG: ABC transporter permease [Trueperaceae bacterium]
MTSSVGELAARTPFRVHLGRVLSRRRGIVIGSFMVLSIVLVAIFAPYIAPASPNEFDVMNRLQPPNPKALFGTDDLGRDIFSRVVYGARVSLSVGFLVSLACLALGGVFGVLSGFYPRLDGVLMRIMDGFMSFPNIVLAILLMATLGASLQNIIIALSITYAPRMARVVRGAVLQVRELSYVEAARALGARDGRLLGRHVVPNAISPIIVQWTFIFAYAILGEASLSFLGVGVPPDVPTWGTILNEGRVYIQRAAWLTVLPGLAILWTVLGLNLLGDGIRDMLDPHLRGSG